MKVFKSTVQLVQATTSLAHKTWTHPHNAQQLSTKSQMSCYFPLTSV